jgi:hypothetical protein
VDAGTWGWSFDINGNKNHVELSETNAISADIVDIFPLGLWFQVGFDLRLGTPTLFTVNGAVQNHPAQSGAADAGPRTFVRADIKFGADRTSSGKNWQVDYDDIACDVLP